MKSRLFMVFFSAAAALIAANHDRHVILITIDGFPSRLLKDPTLPVPILRQLAAKGVVADGMQTSNPSITWPAHTTLVTGVTSRKHGVLANGQVMRQSPGKPPKIEQWVDKTQLVHVPTIYDIAHSAGLTTAESDWVAITRAKTINWSFAELAKPGGPVEQGMIEAGIASADEIAWVEQVTQNKAVWRDTMYTRAACYMIKKHRPNLLLYHAVSTDGIHHRYGVGSNPGFTALAFADRLIGDIVRAVDEAGIRSRTTFIITTDHGFKNITRFCYPNVALKQAGFLTAAGPRVTQCAAYVIAQGGIGHVYITDPAAKPELVPKLLELFRATEGVQSALVGSAVHQLGMPTPDDNPSAADIILFAKDGFGFMEACVADEVVGPALNYSASHGYSNTDNDLDGIFIASGAGIRRGLEIGRITNLDVAPTIAQLLGLELPNADGKCLDSILTLAQP